jgi:lactoylglutathione lyase
MTSRLTMTAPMEVGIACRHLPTMRHFYEHVLGMQFISEAHVPAGSAQRFAMAQCGLTVVRLQTPRGERIKLLAPDVPPAPAQAHSGEVLAQPNAMYLTFIVSDIATTLQRLLAQGGTGMTGNAPVESRPGLSIAFLRDPEGNVLELVDYADIAAYRPDLA